ncbi:MAG: 3D domain-containing protein [Firmicutes bacterium]|nr:3D domain-containing protein [Bacillota bacterium]
MTKWRTVGLRSWFLGAAAVCAVGAGIVGTQFQHVDIVVQGPTGKNDYSIWTFRKKVKTILQEVGFRTNRHDSLIATRRTAQAAEAIYVKEAVPIWIKTAHHRIHLWTTHYHVQTVLEAAKIKLQPLDLVRPALNAKVTASTTINVIRRWWVTKRTTEWIPFRVVREPAAWLPEGHTVLKHPGRDGVRVKWLKELVANGRVAEAWVAKTQVARWPEAEVIEYGTARPAMTMAGPIRRFQEAIPMLSTAYWPDPQWSTGYTATGIKARYGIAAVDPAVIPLGSRLYIPGYGYALAADTGGAIVGDRIDLCYDTATQAIDWGVREVTVYVLNS